LGRILTTTRRGLSFEKSRKLSSRRARHGLDVADYPTCTTCRISTWRRSTRRCSEPETGAIPIVIDHVRPIRARDAPPLRPCIHRIRTPSDRSHGSGFESSARATSREFADITRRRRPSKRPADARPLTSSFATEVSLETGRRASWPEPAPRGVHRGRGEWSRGSVRRICALSMQSSASLRGGYHDSLRRMVFTLLLGRPPPRVAPS